MNVQDHTSGGQAPNQGTVSQNNWNSQMLDFLVASAGAAAGAMNHHDLLKLRQYMQILVYNILQQKQPSPDDAASKAKYMEVARRLEEGLFKTANSKEEYANESTLESRLASLIKNRVKNSNQGHANSSSVGRMVLPTTTGLSHAGSNPSSMVTSSACASVGLGSTRDTVVPLDNAIREIRGYMRTLVLSELHKRQPYSADDASKARYLEVAIHLEEDLFQMANTKEEYLNQSTLTSRMATLIKGRRLNTQQNANSSPPGTMTTLPPEVSPETTKQVSEDELEREIGENLKSLSLFTAEHDPKFFHYFYDKQ